MAEGNSHLDILPEENGTLEPPSHVEGAGEISPPSQKEEDNGKGNNYVMHGLYDLMNVLCANEFSLYDYY